MYTDYHVLRVLHETRLRKAAEHQHQHELRRQLHATRRKGRAGHWRSWLSRQKGAWYRPQIATPRSRPCRPR